jgi:hypothetical protein
MAAVVVVASFLSVCIQAEKWTRYALAAREYRTLEKGYGEGRCTLNQCVEKSRKLMKARLAVCATKGGQIAAIKAHLSRGSSLIEREINWPESLHDDLFHRRYDIAEARESLLECEAALNKLTKAR